MLNKLRESETVKRVCTLVMLGALVLGGATACTTPNNNPTNPSIGGTITPTSPISPSTPGSQGSSPNQDNNKHSDLLMSVVNDKDYTTLMSKTRPENYKIPAFDPHPYAFLEDEGIDIDKILDGTYKANTMTFVLDDEPNNLYMNTRVLIDDSYYQAYLITYKLTDKEMADYKLIHGDYSKYSYSWPAFFINDKISETKQPTKVLETKYTKLTHEVFQKSASAYVSGIKDYILPSIDQSSKSYYYLEYHKHFNPDSAKETKEIFIATFKYSRIRNANGIYEISQDFDSAQILEKAQKQATTFDLQEATIFRGKEFDDLTNVN